MAKGRDSDIRDRPRVPEIPGNRHNEALRDTEITPA